MATMARRVSSDETTVLTATCARLGIGIGSGLGSGLGLGLGLGLGSGLGLALGLGVDRDLRQVAEDELEGLEARGAEGGAFHSDVHEAVTRDETHLVRGCSVVRGV